MERDEKNIWIIIQYGNNIEKSAYIYSFWDIYLCFSVNMKKFWFLFSLFICGLLLTWCNKVIPQLQDTIAFNQLKETFTWNIVDWTNIEVVVDITWNYTLYFNDEFGIATVLWEEWKWYSVWVQRIEDDLEYGWEVIKIKRPMILLWTPIEDNEYKDLFLMDFYHYWFDIVSNEDVEKLKTSTGIWTTSYMQWYRWENNKYSFFETSARNWNQRYLLQSFPNLDCRTWTGWVEYDIGWNPHEYLDADCNWYEVINWEAVKTRKSWVEQLFPYWFLFYDI